MRRNVAVCQRILSVLSAPPAHLLLRRACSPPHNRESCPHRTCTAAVAAAVASSSSSSSGGGGCGGGGNSTQQQHATAAAAVAAAAAAAAALAKQSAAPTASSSSSGSVSSSNSNSKQYTRVRSKLPLHSCRHKASRVQKYERERLPKAEAVGRAAGARARAYVVAVPPAQQPVPHVLGKRGRRNRHASLALMPARLATLWA
eukprot:gene22383-biopygen17734